LSSATTDWLTVSVGGCVAILLATVLLVWFLVVRAYRKQKKVEHQKAEKGVAEEPQGAPVTVPLSEQGQFGFGVRDWQGFQDQIRIKREKLMKKRVEFAEMDKAEMDQDEVQPDESEVQPDLESNSEEDDDLTSEEETKEINTEEFWKHVDERGDEDDNPYRGRFFQSKKVEKAKKDIEGSMTEEERQQEAEMRRQQLENIFKLMQEQEEKFGMSSVNDVQEQLKMYSL